MKKLFFSLLVGAAVIATACADGRKTYTTNPTVLPTQAQTFLKKNFSTLDIQQIEVESKMIGREYEVVLAGGCEIDFNNKGEWTKVDCGRTAVPANVIPAKISKYVADTYPGLFITQIEKEDGGYDVELSDHTDLEFTAKGDFLRIDH